MPLLPLPRTEQLLEMGSTPLVRENVKVILLESTLEAVYALVINSGSACSRIQGIPAPNLDVLSTRSNDTFA